MMRLQYHHGRNPAGLNSAGFKDGAVFEG